LTEKIPATVLEAAAEEEEDNEEEKELES